MKRSDKAKLTGALIAFLLLLGTCAWLGYFERVEPAPSKISESAKTAAGKTVVTQPSKQALPEALKQSEAKTLQLEQLKDGSWLALFSARTLKDPSRFQSLEYLVVPEKGEKAYEGLAVVPSMGWKVLRSTLSSGYPIVELRWKNELGQTVRHNLAEIFPTASPTLNGNDGVLLNHEKNTSETKNPNLPPDGTEIQIAVHLTDNFADEAWKLWE